MSTQRNVGGWVRYGKILKVLFGLLLFHEIRSSDGRKCVVF